VDASTRTEPVELAEDPGCESPSADNIAANEGAARRARALFEGIEDSVFVHDMDGKILDANPAASRKLGYTREEFLTLNTRDIDAPEFAEGYECRLGTQLQEGHLHCEGQHRTKDGRRIPVDINTSTIVLEDKPVVLAVIRDISERKALEQARAEMLATQDEHARAIEQKNRELSESEARYRMLTEASMDAVIVADADATVILFNPAAERAFGYSSVEALGLPLSQFMPDDLPGDPIVGITDAVRRRDAKVVGHTIDVHGRRKDGSTFPLEISISAIESADGLQFLGSIRDQTERRKMEAMLVQSEKLASIGLLSAGVAHEINNPLAFIGNNLAVLERDLKGVFEIIAAYETADAALATAAPAALAKVAAAREDLDWDYVRENLGRMLTRTREGVSRVASIVNTMRGLARTAPPVLEPSSLANLISAALELIQGRCRRGDIATHWAAPPVPFPPIRCVSTQISQVLLNLLVNAVQAVEESSREGERSVRVQLLREPGYQIVEVTDTGDGVSAESLPHLFDPFFTTKPVGEGTGLGLSISHGIITGHGGRIEVDSPPGQGATFRVRLPERS
jgi:two-component system, NtrC family, sensor kinase